MLQAVPSGLSRFLCRRLLQGFMTCLPERRRLILSQIRESFPDGSCLAWEDILGKSIKCLADGVVTFARIPRMTDRAMDQRVVLHGADHIEAAYRRGQGMITFTAHYGCWELMAVYVTRRYPRVAMLVRPLDNPRLDGLVAGVRRSGGGTVIDSRRVFQDGVRHLRANGILGVLVDQNFHKGGVFVDFFGRPAATSTLVPVLARRTGCAVLPMHNFWRDGRLHIICEPPVTLSSDPDSSRAIAEDTQRLTAIVERWIREDPGQWLWLHRRWKRRPQPGERIYAPPRPLGEPIVA
jgi:Kdo2-lipid IVA lauroyltransferase/acyltransferase